MYEAYTLATASASSNSNNKPCSTENEPELGAEFAGSTTVVAVPEEPSAGRRKTSGISGSRVGTTGGSCCCCTVVIAVSCKSV